METNNNPMNNRRKFLKQLSGLAAMVGLPTAGIAAINNLNQGEKDKKKAAKSSANWVPR